MSYSIYSTATITTSLAVVVAGAPIFVGALLDYVILAPRNLSGANAHAGLIGGAVFSLAVIIATCVRATSLATSLDQREQRQLRRTFAFYISPNARPHSRQAAGYQRIEAAPAA